MAGTTTSQFGRRGAGQASGGDKRPEAIGVSSALQMAIGRNRAAPSELPPDMAEAIAQVNRTLAAGPAAAIDRGQAAPRPDLMTMLFSAQGRVRRRDYWLFSTAASMTAALLIVIAAIVLPAQLALVVALPIALASLRIGYCLTIKRWHDRGKSGAWVLIGLVPFVGWVWSLLECGVADGTPGPNRFGPSPK